MVEAMKYMITVSEELPNERLEELSKQLEQFFLGSDNQYIIITDAQVHLTEGEEFLKGKLEGLNESYAIFAEEIRQLREYKKRPWWWPF
jgi:hypothetical protein